jgi:hypothetical protein
MPVDKTPLTDKSPMTFGKHKGTPMGEVPGDYLQWLSGQPWITDWPAVNAYLRKNMDLITKEAEEILGGGEDEEEGYSSYEDYERDIKRN